MTTAQTITIGIDIRLIGKGRTGDEVVFFQLVRELIRRRDEGIRYELYTDETKDDRLASLHLKLETLGRPDIEIVVLPARNRFTWNAFVLPWRLFRRPVDVFHTQYILPLFLPRRLKVVTHVHDISFRVHPEWVSLVDRFFLAVFIPHAFSRSDRILTPSHFTRDELAKHYDIPKDRIVVVENAAAEEWFQPTSEETIQRVTRKYGVKPQHYFISSGTLQPRKNIPFLIEAFLLALKEHGDFDQALVLTGNPSGHNVDVRTRETGHARIIYAGYVSDEDLRSLVAGARAYVFPSLYEGFGIPIEEALAKGTPVLASDIPVFHEVGRDRVGYFDPRTLAPLAKNLYTLSIENSAERLGNKPFSAENRMYSWAKSAARLASLYQSLVRASDAKL